MYPFFAACGIAALLLVAVAGSTSYGAKISISIAGISLQPSEFVKIAFVFFVAGMLHQKTDFRQVCITSAVAAVHVLILVFSKDLGAAFLLFVTYVVMLYVASRKLLYFAGGLAAGSAASVVAYHIFSHIRVRVLAWKNPLGYIDKEGYQVSQSLFAIGTGGWLGMGLYQGIPGQNPGREAGFYLFSDRGGAWRHLCAVPDPGMLQLFPDVYEHCDADEGSVLQAGGTRAWYSLCDPGILNDWRCDKVHPVHGCDAAACQLWRKLTALLDDYFCNYSGTLHFKAG